MTTIEWLQAKLWENNMLTSEDLKLFDQAKEMEKQDIMNAYKADLHPCSDEEAQQYYNETFKQQEQ
jgi:hypothetical protein